MFIVLWFNQKAKVLIPSHYEIKVIEINFRVFNESSYRNKWAADVVESLNAQV